MRSSPPIRRLILSMYESVTFLTDVCRLDPHIARELIELVIMSQWAAVRMNGIEWVHCMGQGYTTVGDVLDDALEEMEYSEKLQLPREHLHHAAQGVLVDMPEQDTYWEELNEHGSLSCQIVWRSYDVLIRFI